MPVRSRSLLAGLGLALLAAGLLTACAAPAGTGGTTPSPATTSTDDDNGDEQEVSAAWLDGGRMIGIVTQGSSTCIPVAEEATYDDGVMMVTLVDAETDKACTADLVPRATLVGTPTDVDPVNGVEIEVTGDGWHGDTDLEGVAGLEVGGEADYLPSAGWADVDGQFVILTWGSSSCAPQVENTEATSATEVTVTFVTPPADQVCTMDMAPRGVVTAVNGLEDEDAETFAILTGGEFDNIRIPIYPN
ncbi:hypothetical protein JNB63_18605 [Microbacterium trichothecenolyticum]|uniref:hypothetical protein n=1 Tax=Microbacterium trichothecenolyticum TaxID=69370 RepID=UPI001C6DFE2E|nr:hypothetical protein [Microbacterium trichothecenolyticum]MBW9122110.1 hypothetical protein [Microbacterium trichothecenolyticum]